MEVEMNTAIQHEAVPVQRYEADWLKNWVVGQVPDSDGEGVNIIVIDTPAYLNHPCFPKENIIEAWEFITKNEGVQIYPRPNQPGNILQNRLLNEKFAAHGTAVLGLLCAQRAEVKVPLSSICEQSLSADIDLPVMDIEGAGGSIDDEPRVSIELPALGLVPEADIYLLALSFDSEPGPYLSALEKVKSLTESGGQWVVVMPRGIPRPGSLPESQGDEQSQQWLAIDDNVRAISLHTPFFYAAGNSQEDEVTYPGTLFYNEDPRTDLLFAVGARNSSGKISRYSSSAADIYCPSDDAEVIYRNADGEDIYYLDEANISHLDDPVRKSKAQASEYVFHRVISTDVPGRYGYNPSALETDQFDIKVQYQKDLTSLFCEFGGTSAAAVVAGALAARGLGSGVIDLSDVEAFQDWISRKSE